MGVSGSRWEASGKHPGASGKPLWKPLGTSLGGGASGEPLGSLWGASGEPLGSLSGSFWESHWELLGSLGEPSGSLWERSTNSLCELVVAWNHEAETVCRTAERSTNSACERVVRWNAAAHPVSNTAGRSAIHRAAVWAHDVHRSCV